MVWDRVLRSIHEQGVLATASWVLQAVDRRLHQPFHVLAHLAVPVEMLRNPRDGVAWFSDRFAQDKSAYRRGLPWIAWPCVHFLDSYITPAHRVFEWGGGGSTIYFLKKGCAVTTVESDSGWAERLEGEIAKLGPDARVRWSLRMIPVTGQDHPLMAEYVAQVHFGGPWDVVMVDAWQRRDCFFEARGELKTPGLLILDNADRARYRDIPSHMKGWEHRPFRGLGVSRSWVTQTDVYLRTAQ